MRLQLSLVVLLVWVGSAPASASSEEAQRAEVHRHFDAGMAHFNLREYKQAIAEFQAAYRLKPDPVFLYNLGQSYRLADDPEQALYFYRAYLRTSDEAPNRSEVEGRIVVLEKLRADKQRLATPPDHALTPPTVSQGAPAAGATTPPAPRHATPIYKRWWLWTLVGGVAAGAAVGLGVGLGTSRGASFNANVGTVGPAALTVRF
jgi:tetratricopeptide (TPR) repeat protein